MRSNISKNFTPSVIYRKYRWSIMLEKISTVNKMLKNSIVNNVQKNSNVNNAYIEVFDDGNIEEFDDRQNISTIEDVI